MLEVLVATYSYYICSTNNPKEIIQDGKKMKAKSLAEANKKIDEQESMICHLHDRLRKFEVVFVKDRRK